MKKENNVTDRELLEMAAKAAGIEIEFVPAWGGGIACLGGGHYWNPLTNDSDAIRLALCLSISLDVNGMFVHADCRNCDEDIGYFEENTARNDGCIFTATRRAIVRAAAEIGRNMP